MLPQGCDRATEPAWHVCISPCSIRPRPGRQPPHARPGRQPPHTGNKNGTIYNEPGGPGDQFFWDFRLPEVADYFVSSVMSTVADPAVDGTFSDDVVGFPAEHEKGPANIKMNDTDLADLQFATLQTSARLIETLVAAGKYNWQVRVARVPAARRGSQRRSHVPA